MRARGPCRAKRLAALVRILDDIEDEAEINDVGGAALAVGVERGIPAVTGDVHIGENPQIVAVPAAVVEDGVAAVEESEVEQEADGFGERGATLRRAMPRDGLGGGLSHWASVRADA